MTVSYMELGKDDVLLVSVPVGNLTKPAADLYIAATKKKLLDVLGESQKLLMMSRKTEIDEQIEFTVIKRT